MGSHSARTRPHGSWIPTTPHRAWWQQMWDPFWVLPMVCVLLSIALGLLLPLIDELLRPWLPPIFQGGPSGARTVLSTITTSMISVTGLVFSITVVVLQLASAQFSPRVLGFFLNSRVTQMTLGVFAGTFMYAITVLSAVRGGPNHEDAFVPQLSVSFAYVSVVASVCFFLAFLHHITTSIQVNRLVGRIRTNTVKTIDRMVPEDQSRHTTADSIPPWQEPADLIAHEVHTTKGGVLVEVNFRGLLHLAEESAVTVQLVGQIGHFYAPGMLVARIWAPEDLDDGALPDSLLRLLSFSPSRDQRQDVLFGIRQLVDVAERALSPAVNDPTTAAQCLDGLQVLCRRLATRPTPSGQVLGEDLTVRLVFSPQSVQQCLQESFAEITHWGARSLQIPAALQRILKDLIAVSRPEYQQTLERLLAGVRRSQDS